jgi:hypothetical protein
MNTRIVCLANSYKEGGRCIAGVKLDERGAPEKPVKWIRPVCMTTEGEIPTQWVQTIRPLDIIEFEKTADAPKSFQTENIFFDEKSLQVTGKFPLDGLEELCDQRQFLLFGSKTKAVEQNESKKLNHSLTMIYTTHFKVYEHQYEDKTRSQVRLRFSFDIFSYDFPVTDPVFLSNYQQNKQLLADVEKLYLTLSLGRLHEGWHYKLVACVLY